MLLSSLIPLVPTHQASIVIQNGFPANGQLSVLVESQRDLTASDIELLQSYGTVTTVAGPIAVLHTNSEYLPEIARVSFIVRIEKSYPLDVQLDKSVPDIGAPQVWDEVKDPSGRNVTGTGVIVGFVDTGIDTTHPDFTFPNGTTKILYVWDQTTPGRPPAGFGYGYECTSADIEARTCPEIDTFGHGTHVAGIAASSGRATGNYTGVAPGASIIFVKSGHEVCNGDSWTFDTNQILDGISYMAKKAAELNMRLVVSLSLGGNIGSHDGTDPFERALDAFVKEGVPIVVAAGNAAQDQDHIDGQIMSGENTTFQFSLRESTTDVAIDIWYSTQDQLSGTLHAPDGTSYPIKPISGVLISNVGEVNTTSASFANGNELYIEVNSSSGLPLDGWSVSLIGSRIYSKGLWNAWTDTETCSFPGSYFLPGKGYSVDPRDTLGIPGTATDVVTVGSYITKNSWRGMDGQTYGASALIERPIGAISSFSSFGPTRDGRIKPDVVAPGEVIASARSSAVPESPSDPDAYHRILAGTSMATPHVAGTIALMLQYEPNLAATDIPQILRTTARWDQITGLLPTGSPAWGFGKIDARTATGLSRQTILIVGVNSTVSVPLLVNRTTTNVQGNSWTNLYYLKGTTLNVTFPYQIQASATTRYEFESAKFIGSSPLEPVVAANYAIQYLLTVSSPYGPTTGAGWYDANTNAILGAPEAVSASGIPGYFGADYVFNYWITGNGVTTSNTISMSQPQSVTAVYTISVPELTLAELIIGAVVLVLAVVVLARRKLTERSAGESSTSS
jgi:subtilisin family serine protease